MAEAKKNVELVSKDGKRTWSTNDAVEITNLRAQGWQEKAAYDKAQEARAEVASPKEPAANKADASKSTK